MIGFEGRLTWTICSHVWRSWETRPAAGCQRGQGTVSKTSSTTFSGVWPDKACATARRELPHCMLRSFSGEVISILCKKTLRAAMAMTEGVV